MGDRDIIFSVRKDRIDNLLNIRLKMKNMGVSSRIQLYKGKVKIEEIFSNGYYEIDENFLYLESKEDTLIIDYKVRIGYLGKHGKLGVLSDDLISFMGEQILILPVEILTLKDRQNLNYDIEINFFSLQSNFKNKKEQYDFKSIIPFKQDNFISKCKKASWSDLYELMKSAYVFGYFENKSFIQENGEISIYIDWTSNLLEDKVSLYENIIKLCNYYFDLFKSNNNFKKDINIVLLRKEKGEHSYILGGSGKNIISSTFDEKEKRDWQLLSHRLFHGFMDSILTSREYHLPPNLWLTEGLATYYENLALKKLSNDLKEELNISFTKELHKLYVRYLYMTLKEPNRYRIIPMEEPSIKSHGKLEFLHYTKAPLLVYLIENSLTNNRNNIVNYLVSNCEKEFSMQHLFYSILGNKIDEFASKYLFGNSLISLFNIKSKDISEEEIISWINEYEYIMWTWFQKEEELYVKDNINLETIHNLKKLLDKNNVIIYNKEITFNIERYSKLLSNIIKLWLLKEQVLNVSYNDLNLRYKLLKDKINLNIWNDFLENN